MRIVHLLAPADYGGLETVVVALAGGLREAGDEVRVVPLLAPGGEGSLFVERCRAAGLEVEPVVVAGRAYLQERAEVRRIVRDSGAEVVHTHGYRPDVVDAGVARRAGAAIATTVHGFTRHGIRGRAYEWMQVRSFRRFDAVVAVSRPLAVELQERGVPGAVLHTIPNAWTPPGDFAGRAEARRRLGLPQDGPVLGWVGRMSVEKAPDLMLEALVRSSHPGVRLCLVGDGPLREPLEEGARREGVADRVFFPGRVPDAGLLLRAFDGVVLSSRTEGTPMILLEAMSAGVPVITTAVGGIPDIVSEAEAFVVQEVTGAALAGAIDTMLAAPEDAARRAERARERVGTEFAVGPWIERYRSLYSSMVRRS